MNRNREIFRAINGYDNYEISNHGRVRNVNNGKFLKASNNKGYKLVSLSMNGKQKTYRVHRLVAQEFLDNPDDKEYVDHIDGDPTNNHVDNLRYATPSQNCMNQKRRCNNTTGFKGVTFDKSLGNYQAQIQIGGRRRTLGHFATAELAYEAYKKKATEVYGEFARFK